MSLPLNHLIVEWQLNERYFSVFGGIGFTLLPFYHVNFSFSCYPVFEKQKDMNFRQNIKPDVMGKKFTHGANHSRVEHHYRASLRK